MCVCVCVCVCVHVYIQASFVKDNGTIFIIFHFIFNN